MARNIYCLEDDKRMRENAKKYNEYYESVEGTAKVDLVCDSCDLNLKKGMVCFAAVLLPSKTHENYNKQKPENWCKEYFE